MKKINLILTLVTIIFLLQNILLAQIEKSPDLKFYGEAAGNNFGFSTTDAGDVNGDGYGDILVGAPYFNANTGRAYIFFGSPNMDNIPDIILNGQSPGNYFGKSVSTAGDVNADGFSDILVSKIGVTYIYFGSNNFDTNPDVTLNGNNDPGPMANISNAGDVNNDGFDDVLIGVNNLNYAVIYYGGTNMDNSYDVYLQNGNGNFGFCVSTAGDFNKDGFSDVIIGEHEANSSTGRANIFFGGTNMNNTLDLVLNGEITNSIFGHTVSDAGDVNGDGFDDIVVGAPYYNNLLGRTYIYFGGANPDNAADVIIPGQLSNSHFGHTVSKAGDFNRDGFKDIIVGSITYDNKGRIDIFYGGTNMNTVPDLYMLGNNDQLGFEVSTAGDVNGDGSIDLLASARANDDAAPDAGIIYMFLNPLSNFVTSVAPKQNAINVNKSSDVSVTFSQVMNAATINSSNIKTFGLQTGLKSSTVSYNAGTRTATINPNSDFKVGEKIHVTLSLGIQTSSNTAITPLTWTFTVQALGGTGVFTESEVIDSIGNGFNGVGMVSGDFDGDNLLDLAEINYNSADMNVYKNNGNSNFSLTQTINSPGLNVGGGLLTGDMDNDGDLDLFLSFYSPVESSYVFKNNGSGIFSKSFAGIPGSLGGEMGDMDGDGDLDIISVWYNNQFKLFLNDGNGNLNYFPFNVGSGTANGMSLGDIDNDGDIDVICAKNLGGHSGITIIKNDGHANFVIGNTFTDPSSVYFCPTADIDSDGDLDVIANEVIFINDGSGNFSSRSTPTGLGEWILQADIDADGDIDNAYIKSSIDKVRIYKNNGLGVFSNSQNVTVGDVPATGASGDFDGDGDIDLAISNYHGHSGQSDISILLNDVNCSPPSAALSGSLAIPVNSSNSVFTSSTENGYWDIANFDNTQASIPQYSEGDSVVVTAGNQLGHFILYFIAHNQCGDTVLFAKHGYVENPGSPSNINVGLIPEGYFNTSANQLSKRDTINVYLRNINAPYALVDSVKTVLDSVSLTTQSSFQNAPTGTYYIVVKHRNSLETWSKAGGKLFVRGMTTQYDFTSSPSQAYGNNLVLKGGYYCIFSGDANQDGGIDLSDLELIDNDLQNYSSGYIPTDINGDGGVDISDMTIAENNSFNFVTVKNPIVGDGQESQLSMKSKLSTGSKLSRERKLSKDTKSLSGAPEKFELKDNYPNPFNPTTKINYSLPKAGNVSLVIFDITGREVATLVNENQNAGKYSVQWDASKFSSGTYFYKIVSGEFSQVKRMILVK